MAGGAGYQQPMQPWSNPYGGGMFGGGYGGGGGMFGGGYGGGGYGGGGYGGGGYGGGYNFMQPGFGMQVPGNPYQYGSQGPNSMTPAHQYGQPQQPPDQGMGQFGGINVQDLLSMLSQWQDNRDNGGGGGM